MELLTTTTKLICLILLTAILSCQPSSDSSDQTQPVLGYRAAKIIEDDNFQFKDLNGNGQLDPYEDWRLSDEERSKDLVSRMSLEQKAGFMLISTTRLENDWSFGRPQNTEPITSGFNETDMVQNVNIFTRKPLD
ncbi:MAG: glycoside hydrolase family 3 protein, partial [Bacteroidetes bacterium]|nr:glycoside hydrolase family 3 protein [Bacteroidota bacterium]